MKIRPKNIEFTSFSDGICNIYYEDEEGNKEEKYRSLGFENRTLGYKRHFTAKSVHIQVNNVIRIPDIPKVNNYDLVEIIGVGKFRIELIQTIYNSNPSSKDLTLRLLESWDN